MTDGTSRDRGAMRYGPWAGLAIATVALAWLGWWMLRAGEASAASLRETPSTAGAIEMPAALPPDHGKRRAASKPASAPPGGNTSLTARIDAPDSQPSSLPPPDSSVIRVAPVTRIALRIVDWRGAPITHLEGLASIGFDEPDSRTAAELRAIRARNAVFAMQPFLTQPNGARPGLVELAVPPATTGTVRVLVSVGAEPKILRLCDDAAFTARLPGETVVLPDVTLSFAPILARGRVTDASDRPIAGAPVVAYQASPSGAAGLTPWWNVIRTLSQADGSYELRGVQVDPIVVISRMPGLRGSEPHPLERLGATVDLVVRKAGSIEGSIRSCGAWKREALRLSACVGTVDISPNWSESSALGRTVTPAEDGRFAVLNVPPGRYSLVVRIVGQRVLAIDDVVVVAGEPCRDPRLKDLVIEPALASATVLVTDDHGAPVRSAQVEVMGAGGGAGAGDVQRAVANESGVASFALPPQAEYRVTAGRTGFAPSVVDRTRLPATIALAPLASVQITFGAGSSVAPGSLALVPLDEIRGEVGDTVLIPPRLSADSLVALRRDRLQYTLDVPAERNYAVIVAPRESDSPPLGRRLIQPGSPAGTLIGNFHAEPQKNVVRMPPIDMR